MLRNSQEVADLKANMGNLAPHDQKFAQNLLAKGMKYGSLSGKQWFWVCELAKRATQPQKEMAKTETGSLAGLKKLFDTAKAKGHKSPALTCFVPPIGEIRLNVAGHTAQKPGSINVVQSKTMTEDKVNVWFGRVDGSTFEESRKQKAPEQVVSFLQKMSADPVGTAKEQARLTKRCMFCELPLKDERSTAMGYGRTCAKNWDLPWGDEKTDLPQLLAEAA